MSLAERERAGAADAAPGEESAGEDDIARGFIGYAIGLALAALLTAGSFWLPTTDLVWAPAVPIALAVFAIAQMGVHLVFFLHMTTAPDHTNNALALAFGVLIVFLVLGGSIWIMSNVAHNMPADHLPPEAQSNLMKGG